MGPTPQEPQKSIPTSPKHSAVSSSQMQAYSKSGSFHHTQSSPQEAHLVNTRLVEELRTVVVMNDKWQKYHKQQEKFINDLQIKLQQQRLKTEKAEKCYSNSLITQQLQEKKLKDQEETIKCFGGIVEELNIAKGKIHKLEEEAKKSRHLSVKNNSNNRDEDVQLLQYQLQVCIDDFKREEREKAKLQDTLNSSQAQLKEANRLLAEYQEKVKIMKSINFPSIHEANPDANYIPKEKPSHRRRNRMSSSAPTRSGMSCRLDGVLNFPTTIEADSFRHSPCELELAANFSSSLESENAGDSEPRDESLEMVRH
ncbi:hypothetical protein BSL78_13659 [Apostichopus japonicus]|uniref:Uncharacterized protein n=1 Tax=Stichopus japonicus TaxID=307972 RepID=A0A2G8KN67_STIJA|nr:hypothetical protein BSL78_13659 [Apostichopus japonicus]